MGKCSLIFRKEWADALQNQPDDIRLSLYEAILNYAFTKKRKFCLAPLPMAVFLIAKAAIDKDKETSEKRRKAGKKGRRKKRPDAVTRRVKPENAVKSAEIDIQPPPPPSPPMPPPVEHNAEAEVETVPQKTPTPIDVRQQKFYDTLVPYVGKYTREMVREFYDYWTETTRSGTKMRFELQPTWVVAKRLARWKLQSDTKYERTNNTPETRMRDAADLIASLVDEE